MNQLTTMNNTPARQGILANNMPVPQTTSGTLEHTGTAHDEENITDIPPDFSWMAEIPFIIGGFVWPPASSSVYLPLDRFINITESSANSFPWLAVPMSYHKYFNGDYFLRFTAVKPSRTPGKILVIYSPSGNNPTTSEIASVNARMIKKEWDLAQSNTFELTIPGFNPNRMRVTGDRRRDPPAGYTGLSLQGPSATRNFGLIKLIEAIPYAPGSIYPDSFNIFIEGALQKAEFATPCDSHGVYRDFFNMTT